MKAILLCVCGLLIIPNLAFSEFRSISDKIFSPDYMSGSQRVSLKGQVDLELLSPQPGSKLNTEQARSIVLIDSKEDLSDLPDPLARKVLSVVAKKGLKNFYVFANFLHSSTLNPTAQDYYIAIIPRSSSFKNIIFQALKNSKKLIVGHQVRMIFNKSITIIPQQSEEYPVLTIDQGDLTYSLVKVIRDGQNKKAQLFKALTGEFAYALQIASSSTMARQQTPNLTVENHLIKGLKRPERKAIFEKALSKSNQEQEEGIYNASLNGELKHMFEVLKAGISDLETHHTNPYQALNQISLANDGRVKQIRSSNSEFAHLAKSSLRTPSKSKTLSTQARIVKLAVHPSFFKVIDQLALYVLEKKVSLKNFEQALALGTQRRPTQKTKDSQKSQSLLKKLKEIWSKEFPKQKMTDFLNAVYLYDS